MQSAMLNVWLCFIFFSQLHVSMHQNVDATNTGCHAYLIGFFHPTWAPGLRDSARTAAGARLSRPQGAQPPRVPSLALLPEPLRRPGSRSQAPARTRGPLERSRCLGFSAGLRLDRSGGRGGKETSARGHVTGANMAAPIGVHLLVRTGKHREDSPAGFRTVAHSLCTRVQRDTHSRSDLAEHTTVLSVVWVHGSTHDDTLTHHRLRQNIYLSLA